MGKSAVMNEARDFFLARGVEGITNGTMGIHFNMSFGFVRRARECWFNYDGARLVQLSIVLGPTPSEEEELKLLNLAFETAASVDPFYGTPFIGKEQVAILFPRVFSPSNYSLGGLLAVTVDHTAPADLHRLDIIYAKALEGFSPREISEVDATFGYPAGHA